MDKNIAAFLRVDYPQLADFSPIVPLNMQQSSIRNLAAHLRIESRAIENDINLILLFARENGLNDCLGFEKIVTEKFRRLGFQLSWFNTNFLFFLSLASALTLLLHQLLEPCHTHPQ